MADKRISELASASWGGSLFFAVVEAGTTKQISSSDFLLTTSAQASAIAAAHLTNAGALIATTAQAVSAASGGGVFVKRTHKSYATYDTTTTSIPADDSIPQSSEGEEITTVSHTPSDSTNKLLVTVHAPVAISQSTVTLTLALFKDSETGARKAVPFRVLNGGAQQGEGNVSFQYEMTAGTTSAITFKLRYGVSSGTGAINGTTSARLYGGVAAVTITVDEYTA